MTTPSLPLSRRLEVIALRKEGKTYKEIANVFGFSIARARQLYESGARRALYIFGELKEIKK